MMPDVLLTNAAGTALFTIGGAPVFRRYNATGTLTTLTLANTTASPIAGGFVTPMFGHAFKQGDVPSGTAPQFQIGGVNVPFSMSTTPSLWPDGSLKHAAFMLLVSSGIAVSGSLTVTVMNGGTTPAPSNRTTADFAAGGLDLNVSVTGLDNLSGTWVSDLNTGVSDARADNYIYMDGPAGQVRRIRATFKQGTTYHSNFEGYWFVAALQDGNGNLAGIRHLTRLTSPWYEAATKTFLSFTALTLNNGATLLRDLWGAAGTPYTFTATAGNASMTASAITGYQTGYALRLTSTGTLPAPFATGTTYFAYYGGSQQQYPNTTVLKIATNSMSVTAGNTIVTPTDSGSTGAVHTVQAYPYLCWGGSIFSAQANGRWNYIQGAGSQASDAPILIQFNNTYLRASKMVLPYNLGVTGVPGAAATYTYSPNVATPFHQALETSGPRTDIAWINGWQAFHFYTQAAIDEQAARVTGLIGGSLSICVRSTANGGILAFNNTTYTGMSGPYPTARIDPGDVIYSLPGPGTTYANPSPTNVLMAGWSSLDTSHMPSFFYYPALITGEPQYADMLYEHANSAIVIRNPAAIGAAVASVSATQYTPNGTTGVNPRNVTVNGTNLAGVLFNSGSNRGDAWAIRSVSQAAALASPENSSFNTYFSDILKANGAYAAGIIGLIQSAGMTYASTNGLWMMEMGNVPIQCWMQAFALLSMVWSNVHVPDANMQTAISALTNWWSHVVNVLGGYAATAEETIGAKSHNVSTGVVALIDSDTYLTTFDALEFNSWAAPSASITVTAKGGETSNNSVYVPYVGDYLFFLSNPPSGDVTTPFPAAFSQLTQYWVNAVTPSGSQYIIELAASPPGVGVTSIPNTDTQSGVAASAFVRITHPPGQGSFSKLAGNNDSYLIALLGALNFASGTGTTAPSLAASLADLQNRYNYVVNNNLLTPASEPWWYLTPGY